ncbi:CPBP family intramembrane glutamic endopeptidase [Thalassotalea marina]|uniref:CAAX prenyl protease 2/Lysostaphin resistance protein A-like domain-containing protein n=1 Tax=Thalassotalea marina TaxID=1673741 RepID=A0A919BPK9_9GAMM|nr:type II CAAX endopeptidase family protein [Thalassotalea marina]GHG03746.1 hypothetical protein GCM10017161_36290 [Thalassotalea marina]
MSDTTISNKMANNPSTTQHKITFINTIGWAIVGIICIGILQLILISPLFMSGYFTWDIFQLSNAEFHQTLGVSGQAIFKLFECIATILIVAYLVKRDGKSLSKIGLSIRGFTEHGLIAFALGTLILLIGFVLLYVTNYIDFSINEMSSVPWIANIGLFTAVAIGEEVFCRGYIQHRLSTVLKPLTAMLITSGCFAALHYANDNLNLVGFLNLFLAGILFGVYYMHTNNLLFPIVLHFAWNFIQGPILGFSVSGMETSSWLSITASDNPLITGGAFGFEGSILCTILTVIAIIKVHHWLKPRSLTTQSLSTK